jgi:sugar/nucleoside kinase (ribokinase family)
MASSLQEASDEAKREQSAREGGVGVLHAPRAGLCAVPSGAGIVKVRIAGTGCCLMDSLYPKVDFSSPSFVEALSRREGDGGLAPGRLVFAEDAERFTGKPFEKTLHAIVGLPGSPTAENVGGPSVVALVHASQMLEGEDADVSFYGVTGDDDMGLRLRDKLARTGLDMSRLETRKGHTPSTFVLSDPRWDGGRGERCFVNEVGAAWSLVPGDLADDFFSADIVAFGGTGLVPRIHDGLPGLLERARSKGAFTFVNTVFDFRAERKDGVGPWPFGGGLEGPKLRSPGPIESYRACDLLVMDRDEALRLSGERDLDAALRFFMSSGLGAFAISRGGDSVLAWAGEGRLSAMPLREFPVSERASRGRGHGGDTTGCGDNFAGGLIAALALQMKAGGSRLDFADALSWGIAAGGFTLGILGGTFYESKPGEKRALVSSYRDDWLAQVGR